MGTRGETANNAALGEVVMSAFDIDLSGDNTMSLEHLQLSRSNSSIDSNNDNSLSDDFFDHFGSTPIPEDDDDNTAIPEWILEGCRFNEIQPHVETCMVSYDIAITPMVNTNEDPPGVKLESESVTSFSSGSANYYSCLSDIDDDDANTETECMMIANTQDKQAFEMTPCYRMSTRNFPRPKSIPLRRCYKRKELGHVKKQCNIVHSNQQKKKFQ
jgi:hypothetical protein